MASPTSLLSEKQLQCSICLDIFTNPVSTPCGHSFCQACIGRAWDNSTTCQCPLCKETFRIRPDLSINRVLADIAEQLMNFRSSGVEDCPAEPGEVLCDFCTGEKLQAVKSCLVCLASYCEAHIQPHYQENAFKRHRLTDPVKKLGDRLCKMHGRILAMFCRRDQACICHICAETSHRGHETVPLEEECIEQKKQLGKTEAEVQLMIQERLMKMKEIGELVELSKNGTQREVEDSLQAFTSVMRSLERSQGELIELLKEKQRAVERTAGGLVYELQREITELQKRSSELEHLSHTEDHFHFVQTFASRYSNLHNKDWTSVTVDTDHCLGEVKRIVSQLGWSFQEQLETVPEIKLKRIRQYAVDVTLDPNTAYHKLILSEDGKQVRVGNVRQALPDSPLRFDHCPCVLGKQGFHSGRHYWEVEVGEKTDWDLGVARESINRKGQNTLSPKYGYWAVWLRNGSEYKALTSPSLPLSLSTKPRRIGVYLDYQAGQVSFYNVDTSVHIHTFTDTFTEKLYPFFSPYLNKYGSNGGPLIISPVGLR
ncbi:TRI39 ligase, partial [Amia calva]|nr:TRI39 ligase [Amia calva]